MSEKENSFDLTTPEGLKSFAKNSAVYVLGGPFSLLAKIAYDKFFEPTKEVIDAQAKAAVDIIRAGAEHGASEIEITMSQEAGAHFGTDFEGIPIKCTLGKSGTVKMNIKYKDAT